MALQTHQGFKVKGEIKIDPIFIISFNQTYVVPNLLSFFGIWKCILNNGGVQTILYPTDKETSNVNMSSVGKNKLYNFYYIVLYSI